MRAVDLDKRHQRAGQNGGDGAEEIAAQVFGRGRKQFAVRAQQAGNLRRKEHADDRQQTAGNEDEDHRHGEHIVHLFAFSAPDGLRYAGRAAAGADVAEGGKDQRNRADDAHCAERRNAQTATDDNVVDQNAQRGGQRGQDRDEHKGTIDLFDNVIVFHCSHHFFAACFMASVMASSMFSCVMMKLKNRLAESISSTPHSSISASASRV